MMSNRTLVPLDDEAIIMGTRVPRLPRLPETFAEAVEKEILAVMRDWPRLMEERHEFSSSEAGNNAWQALFERELANPRPDMPDTVATVIAVAEAGHVSAQRALRSYATRLFEDPKVI